MNKFFASITSAFLVGSLMFFVACDEEPPLPDNVAQFETDQMGMSSSEQEITINIPFTREADADGAITVGMELTGVTYGSMDHFTTSPAAANNSLTIDVPATTTATSFKVIKRQGILLDGTEKIKFTISATSPDLVIGEKKELTLSFAEIVSASGQLLISGGGATYPNKVFVDLSANRVTAIARTGWDLGFSTTDDFRVILNSSNGMMARALDKTDMATVTSADTVGFGVQLSLAAVFNAINQSTVPSWVATAQTWIDDPTGDLTKTAIASVSAIDTENKVYIINRGNGPGATQPALGWKKIKIVRSQTGYTLLYADINATAFNQVQITKNPAYRFMYLHLSGSSSAVDPEKTKWDIAWTGFTNLTNFGSGPVPYYFQDIVLQNTSGVQTAQVMESTIGYDAFSEANLTGLTLGTSQINIGSNWRSGGGPGTAPSIRTDRYYIIKDPEGNYYKLKFTALTTNGERGYPQFKYALVKKAGS